MNFIRAAGTTFLSVSVPIQFINGSTTSAIMGSFGLFCWFFILFDGMKK